MLNKIFYQIGLFLSYFNMPFSIKSTSDIKFYDTTSKQWNLILRVKWGKGFLVNIYATNMILVRVQNSIYVAFDIDHIICFTI